MRQSTLLSLFQLFSDAKLVSKLLQILSTIKQQRRASVLLLLPWNLNASIVASSGPVFGDTVTTNLFLLSQRWASDRSADVPTLLHLQVDRSTKLSSASTATDHHSSLATELPFLACHWISFRSLISASTTINSRSLSLAQRHRTAVQALLVAAFDFMKSFTLPLDLCHFLQGSLPLSQDQPVKLLSHDHPPILAAFLGHSLSKSASNLHLSRSLSLLS